MGREQHHFRAVLAQRLRTERQSLGLGQAAFARKLGISQSTLARIESCQQNVTVDMLETICLRLTCKLSDLLPDQ
ncbi:helix-turn-helix domain-containing protein [Gilvimarinus sp. F26214L]|uniref:helix-turn-helix domain-containing protein n=1 Tax=Gilvimarinus sp. DZF01 TaxID=3461371 RepID=UPI00404636E0